MCPLPMPNTKKRERIIRERGQKGQSRVQKQDEHLCGQEPRAVNRTEAWACWSPALKQEAVVLGAGGRGVYVLQGTGTKRAPQEISLATFID